jgi:Sigma-70, region 4
MDGTTAELTPASARLPERQREALELREQEGLSYEEIAARLDASWISVAKLIAHARINLYDELYGTILASMAPSAECERALPLIAAREDEELDPASADGTWLDGHLEDCGRCRRGVQEMGEIAAAFGSQGSAARPSRRRAVLAAGLAALLLFAGVATAMRAGGGSSATPADSAAASVGPKPEVSARTYGPKSGKTSMAKKKAAARKRGTERSTGEARTGETAAAPAAAPVPVEVETGGGGSSEPASRPAPSPAKRIVQPPQPPQPPPASKPVSKPAAPKPAPTPAPAPTPTPSTAPLAEEPAPVEETSAEPPRGREPPGKPAHVPSKK